MSHPDDFQMTQFEYDYQIAQEYVRPYDSDDSQKTMVLVWKSARRCAVCLAGGRKWPYDVAPCECGDCDGRIAYCSNDNSVLTCKSRHENLHRHSPVGFSTGLAIRICAQCGEGTLRMPKCGNCREVYSCRESCQDADWQRHRNLCTTRTNENNRCKVTEHGTACHRRGKRVPSYYAYPGQAYVSVRMCMRHRKMHLDGTPPLVAVTKVESFDFGDMSSYQLLLSMVRVSNGRKWVFSTF
jgi:hypothetical protein